MEEIALKIIRHAFKDKKDKGGNPYVDHLKRVSQKLPDYDDGKLRVIGLLHDLLEDCPEWTEGALRAFFTDSIVDRVVLLTRSGGEDYFAYINRVKSDHWASLVKKADLEDNMDITRLPEITQKDIDRLIKYHKAYLSILEST